jgi:serralysin
MSTLNIRASLRRRARFPHRPWHALGPLVLAVAFALGAANAAAADTQSGEGAETATNADAAATAKVGPVEQLAAVNYTAIDGHEETLVPWQGRHVTVLVEPGVTRDPHVMRKLVRALDRAWSYYAATTGRVPAVAHSLNGRDEVAEVTSTCGAGCTYIGATGTEILTSYFEGMYQQIAQSNLYDQIPFYELGRSFWFWSPQLQFQAPDQDPVVTGFAVWMRFRSMEAAHVKGAPFNGTPFTTFASQVEALAGEYEADPSLTFAETLAVDKSPGLYGGTDFWASLMMQLAERHGGQKFVARFFHHASELPAASSTTQVVTNWVQDASYAACVDLSSVFYERWGFPRPDGSVTPRPPASTVPEPTGKCSTRG